MFCCSVQLLKQAENHTPRIPVNGYGPGRYRIIFPNHFIHTKSMYVAIGKWLYLSLIRIFVVAWPTMQNALALHPSLTHSLHPPSVSISLSLSTKGVLFLAKNSTFLSSLCLPLWSSPPSPISPSTTSKSPLQEPSTPGELAPLVEHNSFIS